MVLAAALLLGGCSAKGQENSDELMYEKGLALLNKMDEMATSQEYRKMFTSSEELVGTVEKIAQQDYSAPEAVYKLTMGEDAWKVIERMEQEEMVGSLSGLSEELKAELLDRLLKSVTNQLNAANGSAVLGATSIFTSSDSFLCKGLTDRTAYFYLYGNDCAGVVVFIPRSDGVAEATASFVINEALGSMASEEKFNEGIAGLDILGLLGEGTVEKIK